FLEGIGNKMNASGKVFASNYYKFCKNILSKYGYLLSEDLKEIDELQPIDDSESEDLLNLNIGLTVHEAKRISSFSHAIKDRSYNYLKENKEFYNKLVIDNFLSEGYIPFNAIIILTLKLFDEYPEINEFYKKYFSYIIVDEFQDTNILGWGLLSNLIEEQSVILMGDPLQKIYNFIGAIPDILVKAESKFNLKRTTLKKNYRFEDNEKMLLLDRNIRKNAKSPYNTNIENQNVANIEILEFENQDEEGQGIVDNILEVRKDNNSKIAILAKQRGNNIDKILEVLDENNLEYFYGLFSEENDDYKEFHDICLAELKDILKKSKGKFYKTHYNKYFETIKEISEERPIFKPLCTLIRSFLDQVFRGDKYNFLPSEYKIDIFKNLLENNGLKQQMEYLDEDIIVSTVHGAKGLEWDYVIIPDMERYSFPNYKGLCGYCNDNNICITDQQRKCKINWERAKKEFQSRFLNELSIFYVAVTRAKEEVYFSYSKKRLNYSGVEKTTYLSCLLNLEGINPIIKPAGE
ncbi:MAG: 3'-5' exonuclease, partial [bacterium]